ncbi:MULTISPECIES: hypothetical protein [Enterococcus]|uniref:hypothetical protein n=1 Tax=Enterococcus TaxID=1350 RepID=UPI001165334E|nr:hypothetical protein [Enterococcus avium]HAP3021853.1 hypothetical protein [Enterococcus faecalis]AYQ24110.1 hypothetical protein AUF16_05445 [Enterococcus avium]HBI1562936.1 hypothetical protein [Enterococcus faecalis]HBI1566054.1 hypothetical protein [Enterococcus faecalis]HBI1717716.1 hypothetical protein [Enterococcus faecalis]
MKTDLMMRLVLCNRHLFQSMMFDCRKEFSFFSISNSNDIASFSQTQEHLPAGVKRALEGLLSRDCSMKQWISERWMNLLFISVVSKEAIS